MMDPKRQEEERKRIMLKYGVREKRSEPQGSRYLEYRNRENLKKEMAEHPEKFIEKKEEPIIETPLQIEPTIDEPPKKKSWFLKLFKK